MQFGEEIKWLGYDRICVIKGVNAQSFDRALGKGGRQ